MSTFTIQFLNDEEFTITDTTDYTALTVTKTDLVITYPPIQEVTEIILDLYDENVATEGLPFTYTLTNSTELTTLLDGVYKFELIIYNGAVIVDSNIMYVVNQQNKIYQFLLNSADAIMDNQCCKDWNELSELMALLELAKLEATNGRYLEGQEIMNYLNNIVNDCGSSLC